MQYKTGTVTIADSATTVTGSGTYWLSRVSAGHLFKILDEETVYVVDSVTSDTELELTTSYSGTQSGASYIIETSITSGFKLPLLNKGLLDWTDFLKYAIDTLDARYYEPDASYNYNRGRLSFKNKLPTTAETAAGISRGVEDVDSTHADLIASGLLTYELGANYTERSLKYYNGSAWIKILTEAPTITSISPSASLTTSSKVTITGTNFGSAQGSNTVVFNGTDAGSAITWSTTSIVIYFPAGATAGNLIVTINGRASNGYAFT